MTKQFTFSAYWETIDCTEWDGMLIEFIEHPDTTWLSTIKN